MIMKIGALPWSMGLLAMILWSDWVEGAAGNVITRIAPTGDAIELDIPTDIGGKSFVTGVMVTLRNAMGATVLTVPAEHITGPWLFIDLPEGMYEVTATLGGVVQVVKAIKMKPEKSLTQHVRWSEDHSPPLVGQPSRSLASQWKSQPLF